MSTSSMSISNPTFTPAVMAARVEETNAMKETDATEESDATKETDAMKETDAVKETDVLKETAEAEQHQRYLRVGSALFSWNWLI